MRIDTSKWDVDRDGAEIVRSLVDPDLLDQLVETCPEGRAGLRDPLAGWPAGWKAARIARAYLSDRFDSGTLLSRAILFDKRENANWHLRLHRDVTIAVARRVDATGFGPWSLKDGQPHVSPPAEVLEQLVTVRLHLDNADERNGCLRVKPCTHLAGKDISADEDLAPERGTPVSARAGDAVLMRPLVLHGSERSTTNTRRRVLHMEFAFGDLPAPLQWARVRLEDDAVAG